MKKFLDCIDFFEFLVFFFLVRLWRTNGASGRPSTL